MKEFGAVFVNVNAGFEELLVIGALGEADEDLVDLMGDDEMDIDAAHDGSLDGLRERLAGDEIRRGENDAALGGMRERDDEVEVVQMRVTGATWNCDSD